MNHPDVLAGYDVFRELVDLGLGTGEIIDLADHRGWIVETGAEVCDGDILIFGNSEIGMHLGGRNMNLRDLATVVGTPDPLAVIRFPSLVADPVTPCEHRM